MAARRWWAGLSGVQRALLLAVVLIAAGFWAQSFFGREGVVRDTRLGCERRAFDEVQAVNQDRLQQNTTWLDAVGNRAVSEDPRQPALTRRTRRHEADREVLNIHREQAQTLQLDSHIDRGEWRLLDDGRDRAAVRYGQRVGGVWRPPFRCDRAYPDPSPFG